MPLNIAALNKGHYVALEHFFSIVLSTAFHRQKTEKLQSTQTKYLFATKEVAVNWVWKQCGCRIRFYSVAFFGYENKFSFVDWRHKTRESLDNSQPQIRKSTTRSCVFFLFAEKKMRKYLLQKRTSILSFTCSFLFCSRSMATQIYSWHWDNGQIRHRIFGSLRVGENDEKQRHALKMYDIDKFQFVSIRRYQNTDLWKCSHLQWKRRQMNQSDRIESENRRTSNFHIVIYFILIFPSLNLQNWIW